MGRFEQVMDHGVDLRTRTLFLVGDVDGESVARLVAGLHVLVYAGAGTVQLVLASAGGDVDGGLALYDALTTCPNPVLVEAYGVCQSMAALILQAGDWRNLAPECRVMVHPGGGSIGDSTPQALLQTAAEVAHLHRRYTEILAARSTNPTLLKSLCGRESYMSAHEAVKLGLADHVLPVRRRSSRKRAT